VTPGIFALVKQKLIHPDYTGCGAMAVARTDNLKTLWFILIIASLGIGGIVVPASIMTTIICPDVSFSNTRRKVETNSY
jgi:hypothetical protein